MLILSSILENRTFLHTYNKMLAYTHLSGLTYLDTSLIKIKTLVIIIAFIMHQRISENFEKAFL